MYGLDEQITDAFISSKIKIIEVRYLAITEMNIICNKVF